MNPHRNHTDLVLEGGGVKGIGLVGAACALARHGYRFDRVAGTSAGAIVGALVAACEARDLGLERLERTVRTIDYREFQDAPLLTRLGAPGKGLQLALHEGLYKGDYLLDWLTDELDELGIHTFADLRIDGVPDSAPLRERYRLVVVAADISRRQALSLPWDYPRYGLDPDSQRVAHAVRASASIPFFFVPVELRGSVGFGASTLVDGGLLWNFPLDIFDRPDSAPDRSTTVGIKLSARVAVEAPGDPSNSAFGVAWDCLSTLLDSHERYHIADSGAVDRIVFVDTEDVSSTDFGIDASTQDRLYLAGTNAAKRWLANHSTPAQSGPASPPPTHTTRREERTS